MFYLNDDEIRMLYSMAGKSISGHARTAIRHLYHNTYSVFEITNTINGRMFFGVCKTHDFFKTSRISSITQKNGRLYFEISELGAGAFEEKILGSFHTIDEANEFLDFKINLAYDSGKVLYNQELYNGFTQKTLTIPIELKLFDKLVEGALDKRLNLSKVFNKIILKLIGQ